MPRLPSILLVLLSLSSVAFAGGGTVYETTGDKVRIRSGPGTRFAALGQLDRGVLVIVTKTEGRWKEVRVPGGFSCYVHGSLVKKNRDGTADVIATRVLLRVTADKDHGPLTTRLSKGETLTVLGSSGDWLEVISPDRATAWIFDGLLAELGPEDEYRGALGRHAATRRKALLGDRPVEEEAARKETEREKRRAQVLALGREVVEGRGDTSEQERRLTRIALESDDDLTRGYAEALLSLVRLRQEAQRLEKLVAESAKLKEEEAAKLKAELAAAKKRYEDARKRADILKGRREQPYRAVGTIEKREEDFVLVSKDRVIFRLQSKRFRMKDYVGKRVGVNGRVVVTDIDRKVTHLLVEKLEILPGKAPERKPQ